MPFLPATMISPTYYIPFNATVISPPVIPQNTAPSFPHPDRFLLGKTLPRFLQLPSTTPGPITVEKEEKKIGVCEPDPDSSSSSETASLWYVGVLMSIIASIASNFGLNVQKLSMNKEVFRVKDGRRERPYIQQPLWALGLLMIIAGAVGDFAALGFAAQSLITPVGGVTMVANVFFAYAFLGESVTPSVKRRRFGDHSKEYKATRAIHRFGYPTLSGLIGAQDVLFAKAFAELVKSTFRGNNQLIYLSTWLIVFMMVACVFAQLHFLAMALKHFDAVYVVPVFQCFFISGSIVAGAVYYREFEEFSFLQGLMFLIAVGVTLIGVFLLSQRSIKLAPTSKSSLMKPRARFKAAVNCIMFLNWRYSYPEWRKKRIQAILQSKDPFSISAEQAGPKLGPRKESLVLRTIAVQTLVTGRTHLWPYTSPPLGSRPIGTEDGATGGTSDIDSTSERDSKDQAPALALGLGRSLPSDHIRTARKHANRRKFGRKHKYSRFAGDTSPEGYFNSNLYSHPMDNLQDPFRDTELPRVSATPFNEEYEGGDGRVRRAQTIHGGIGKFAVGRYNAPGYFHYPGELGMPQFAFGGLDQHYSPEYLRRKEQELLTYTRNVYKPEMLAPVPTGLGLSSALSEVGGYLKRRFLGDDGSIDDVFPTGGESPRDANFGGADTGVEDRLMNDEKVRRSFSLPESPSPRFGARKARDVLTQGPIYRGEGDTVLTPSKVRESKINSAEKNVAINVRPETKYNTPVASGGANDKKQEESDGPFALGSTIPLKDAKQ
eukprot:g1895.t1